MPFTKWHRSAYGLVWAGHYTLVTKVYRPYKLFVYHVKLDPLHVMEINFCFQELIVITVFENFHTRDEHLPFMSSFNLCTKYHTIGRPKLVPACVPRKHTKGGSGSDTSLLGDRALCGRWRHRVTYAHDITRLAADSHRIYMNICLSQTFENC